VIPLLLGSLSCPGRREKVLVYDLVERLPVAELWSSRELLLFGTPGAEPHQVEGFYRESGPPTGDPFLWVREESEVSLTWAETSPRAALLDLAPYSELSSQQVEVRLNDHAVGRFHLNLGRQRYRVVLPAPAQKVGDNRLRLVFARSVRPSDEDPKSLDQRHLAAAFYSLAVGSEDDPTLEDLLARDAPALLEATPLPSPALLEVGPSLVTFALRLPPGAELRFRPELYPSARAAAAQAVFKVTLEDTPGSVREVWSRVVGGNEAPLPEVSLPLGPAGRIVKLSLGIAGAGSPRFAWGVFRAPRVMGLSTEVAPGKTGPAPQGGAATEALRSGLQGLNVLFVILDAGRAREFSCYGHPQATTPEIDAIAKEGVVFEEAVTPAVYTLGAMSSVWTSQYPDRHHGAVSFSDRLPKDRVTLVDEVLSPRDIWTAGFVANAVAGRAFGFERGFSTFDEIFKQYGSGAGGFEKAVPEVLAAHRDRRFFLYLHFREPHFPYDPPPPYDTRFGPDAPLSRAARSDQGFITEVNQGRRPLTGAERDHLERLYEGNLAYADHEVGAMRRTLESMGLWDKTITIVAADHGEELFEHGWVGHNVHLYEESVRVPLIIRFPTGRGPAGRRIGGLVSLLDLAPTIADLYGFLGAGGSARAFQGKTLLPMIAGEDRGEALALSRTVWDRPRYALRDGSYKFLYDTRTGESALFNLETDPGETRDLKGSETLQAAYEQQALNAWIKTLSGRERAEAPTKTVLTRAQCENLKSAGYLPSDYPCPKE
jgi:arylsulfatase A-like enzyme